MLERLIGEQTSNWFVNNQIFICLFEMSKFSTILVHYTCFSDNSILRQPEEKPVDLRALYIDASSLVFIL